MPPAEPPRRAAPTEPAAPEPGVATGDGVMVVGEVLLDVTAGPGAGQLGASLGGSPANVAVGLARLGVPTSFVGRLSTRAAGPALRSQLAAEGIDLSGCTSTPRLPTLAWATLDDEHQASYAFYGPETADWHWAPGDLPHPSTASAAVHTGSLACAHRPGDATIADWVEQLRAVGRVAISYDPNVRRDCGAGATAVERFVAAAHLVKASEEDLELLHPQRSALATAAAWARSGPELVVVTRGAGGAVALRAGADPIERPTPVTAVVDTIGAGDAFSAGLLAWLARAGRLRPGMLASTPAADLADALDASNAIAALTCSRRGADPPRRGELVGR